MNPSLQPTSPSVHQQSNPDSILIIGAGVFGLSTILALLSSPRYDRTTITLLDPYLAPLPSPSDPAAVQQQQQQHHHHHQNPHAASIDSSRIIRTDYAVPAYARLAQSAQGMWRAGFGAAAGGKGVYRESGLVLTAEGEGSEYVRRAEENARGLGGDVRGLRGRRGIGEVMGVGGGAGDRGYVNWGSGWADSSKAMRGFLREVVRRAGERRGVVFVRGTVEGLLFGSGQGGCVLGARLEGGAVLRSERTVVAAGAWSGALVDLRGRAEARGQVMAYVPVTEVERDRLWDMPVLLNLSTGMFVIPPVWDAGTGEWVVKVARHAFGYGHPTFVSPEGETIVTSLPSSKFSPIPDDGEKECRAFLQQTIPCLGDRPFSSTRICWYTDTPTGNFLVSYHPGFEGLFLATGGSGHAFKFLPVLGEKIVAAMEGVLDEELATLWRWREKVVPFTGTEDGSRGGERGVMLEEEWRKGERLGSSKL